MCSTPGGIGRRERFILAIALGAGLGVTLVPEWTQNNLWPESDDMSSGLRGFRDAVILTLSTGYRCARFLQVARVSKGASACLCLLEGPLLLLADAQNEPYSRCLVMKTRVAISASSGGPGGACPIHARWPLSASKQCQWRATHSLDLRPWCLCSLGVLCALILNLLLPEDTEAKSSSDSKGPIEELETTKHGSKGWDSSKDPSTAGELHKEAPPAATLDEAPRAEPGEPAV